MSRSAAFLAVLVSTLAAVASGQAIRPLSVELGGSLAYESATSEADGSTAKFKSTVLEMSPIVRFHPISALFVGPHFVWSSRSGSSGNLESTSSAMQLGGQAGFLAGFLNSPVIPFVGGASGLLVSAQEMKSSFDSDEDSESGFFFSVFGGIKVRLGGSFFMNVQPTYSFFSWEDSHTNVFGVHLGFTGIIGGI